jgi:hypothetical protein
MERAQRSTLLCQVYVRKLGWSRHDPMVSAVGSNRGHASQVSDRSFLFDDRQADERFLTHHGLSSPAAGATGASEYRIKRRGG